MPKVHLSVDYNFYQVDTTTTDTFPVDLKMQNRKRDFSQMGTRMTEELSLENYNQLTFCQKGSGKHKLRYI